MTQQGNSSIVQFQNENSEPNFSNDENDSSA